MPTFTSLFRAGVQTGPSDSNLPGTKKIQGETECFVRGEGRDMAPGLKVKQEGRAAKAKGCWAGEALELRAGGHSEGRRESCSGGNRGEQPGAGREGGRREGQGAGA